MGIYPRVCDGCGVRYRQDFRTGINFRDAVMMTKYSVRPDGSERRFFGRRTVLGQWHGFKQQLWREHLNHCANAINASDRAWPIAGRRHYTVLSDDDRAFLNIEPGDSVDVEIDGDIYAASLDEKGRLVVQAEWRELNLPATSVRIRSPYAQHMSAA